MENQRKAEVVQTVSDTTPHANVKLSCECYSLIDKQCCKVKETKEKAVENDREKIRV